jgi:hypothetical protein
MRAQIIRFSVSVAICLCMSLNSFAVEQESLPDLLERRIDHAKIESKDISVVLKKLAVAFNVPIGFEPELADQDPHNKVIKLDLSHVTLREALVAVREARPRYEWKLNNGVVNVFPADRRDLIIKDILDVRVSYFYLKQGANFLEAAGRIVDTPEVGNEFEMLGVTPLHFSNGLPTRIVTPRRNIELRGVTVSHILGEIAKESPSKFWAIVRWGEEEKLITIGF